MNPITVINLVCNAILTAGMVGFYILLYRTDSIVHKWPLVGSLLLRGALVLSGAGAFFNCISLSTPPISEVVLNAGQAGIFAWAVYFHQHLLKNGSHRKSGKRSNRSSIGQAARNNRKGSNQ